jgi:hypothetical protein
MEISLARGILDEANGDKIESWIARLEEAIAESRFTIEEVGMDSSVYPGEDEGETPASQNIVSYMLDHILRHSTDPNWVKPFGKNWPLHRLVSDLKPLQFIALLTLFADRKGDEDGVVRGAEILNADGWPYLETLLAVSRRAAAGRQSAEQRREDIADRNRKIRARADELKNSGVPKREIAGRLAQRSSDGESLSAHQIRLILKNPDMN